MFKQEKLIRKLREIRDEIENLSEFYSTLFPRSQVVLGNSFYIPLVPKLHLGTPWSAKLYFAERTLAFAHPLSPSFPSSAWERACSGSSASLPPSATHNPQLINHNLDATRPLRLKKRCHPE